ncbi:hypothetical protein EF917_04940 [Streptomyces sp. WAC00469]|nr:hypothetical protein EF917_04940 [Streptomyces sp. WAC00469]
MCSVVPWNPCAVRVHEESWHACRPARPGSRPRPGQQMRQVLVREAGWAWRSVPSRLFWAPGRRGTAGTGQA